MSRDRDRILEQALKHELSAAGAPPAAPPALRSSREGGCLDAETFGAWVDGGLDPAAMAAAEVHVASCARCQALAGTFARSAPVVEATEARAFPLWKWWLAPIAAGVTAVTLWTVIPEQQPIAEAPPQAKVADAVQPSVATEAAAPAAAEQFGARENLAAATRDDRRRAQDKEERKEDAAVRQMQERVAVADAAAPSPAAPLPPAAVALGASGVVTESVTALRKSAAAIEIATLDPTLGWRIVGGNRIERSEDGGKTWKVMLEPNMSPSGGITAGSAPSTSVAWFVGRNGYVLLTTNGGASFLNMSLAEPLDLASVAAIDGRNATIFSVVGRRFRTGDGGQTWLPF